MAERTCSFPDCGGRHHSHGYCPGHPLSGVNLYVNPKGIRVCLTCREASR